MLGYTPQEMIGKNWFELFIKPEFLEAVRTPFEKMMAGQGGNVEYFENQLAAKDGNMKTIYWHNTLVKDNSGNILRTISSGTDVTNLRKAERALIRSRELLDDMSRMAKIGAWELDVASMTQVWTDETYEIHDVDKNTYNPNVDREVSTFLPGSKELLEKAVADAISAGKPYDLDLEMVTVKGSRKWLRCSGRAVVVGGRTVTIKGTVQDVTEHKRADLALRASEAKLRRFYESGLVGVVYWNMDGKITDSNDRFLEMLGYTRAEMESGKMDWSRMTPKQFAGVDAAAIRELMETGVNKNAYEKGYYRKDGTMMPAIIACAMLDEARRDGVAFVLDITERKKAEKDLEAALSNLKRSNVELEQFAFIASHDLQEPLRAITGYVQLLEKKYAGKLDPDADRYIMEVVDGSGRMRSLINDLLAFSRIENTGRIIKEIDMNAVYDTVVYGLGKAISESNAEITRGTLPKVKADEIHMVQLLQNLIANGIKFHGPDRPKVHVSADKKGKEIVFSVKDNGIGIEKEYFDKIFVIFQRLHSREEYPGTGIGLAICKKIVESHDGRIWVESEPGKGSTFYFTLPATE
jgi:PAS domain S-box-containing protein